MHPRPYIKLSPEDAATHAQWSRWTFAGFGLVAAIVVILPAFSGSLPNVPAPKVENAAMAATCAQWDDLAKAALVSSIQNGQDSDLRQAGDTIFRLRRARRHCDMGWLRLACFDFSAIARGKARSAAADAESASVCEAFPAKDERQASVAVRRN